MKYSKEIIAEISKYIKQGLSQKDSALLANISEETFYAWKKSKKKFSESLIKAEAEFKQRNLAIIQKAGMPRNLGGGGSWQASSWLMERKFQDEFAIKQKVELSGEVGGKIILVRPGEK